MFFPPVTKYFSQVTISWAYQYIEDSNFALQIKMLPSFAFVPEDKIIQSFTALMVEFPTTAKKLQNTLKILILEEYCQTIPEEFLHFQ